MKNLLKAIFITFFKKWSYVPLATAFLTIQTFSQDFPMDKFYSNEDNPQSQTSPATCPKPSSLCCEYNCPGRIRLCSPWDVSLSGSYILWQGRQEGMEYGFSFGNKGASTLKPDFDHQSGFKAAICSKFDHDCWDVNIEYTRSHIKNKMASSANLNGYLIPINIYYSQADEDILSTNNNATYCKNIWRLAYDMIDVECSRPSYIGSFLILNPFFGLRGGWIEQKLKATATFNHLDIQEITYQPHSFSRSNSWLLGPRIGVDSTWHIRRGLKLFGNFSASLEYQHFENSFKLENYSDENLLDINAKDKIGYVTPNIDIALGLGWGNYCNQNKWHVEIDVLYDCLYFWSQNYVRQFSDKMLKNILTKPGNLSLSGLTASLKIDF